MKVINKKFFVAATCLFPCLLGASGAKAQDHEDQKCFTVASLDGTYAAIGTYGANVAVAFGLRHADGNGNLHGTFLLNEPLAGSTTGERKLITGTQMGTYTVNCNGTGVTTRSLTASDGVTVTMQMDDFIITGALERDGKLIATSLVDMQRTPSAIVPGGIFLTRTFTRLPD